MSSGSEIAIVGMAGRFPGAGSVTEFWQNLKEGRESIAPDEGADSDEARAHWVKVKGLLTDVRDVRRVVLRLQSARSGDDRSAAPAVPGVRLALAGGRGVSRRRRAEARGGVRRRLAVGLHLRAAHRVAATPSGSAADHDRQRPRLPGHAHLLQDELLRPVGDGAERLLDLAGGDPFGLPELDRGRSATPRWRAASPSRFRASTPIIICRARSSRPTGAAAHSTRARAAPRSPRVSAWSR